MGRARCCHLPGLTPDPEGTRDDRRNSNPGHQPAVPETNTTVCGRWRQPPPAAGSKAALHAGRRRRRPARSCLVQAHRRPGEGSRVRRRNPDGHLRRSHPASRVPGLLHRSAARRAAREHPARRRSLLRHRPLLPPPRPGRVRGPRHRRGPLRQLRRREHRRARPARPRPADRRHRQVHARAHSAAHWADIRMGGCGEAGAEPPSPVRRLTLRRAEPQLNSDVWPWAEPLSQTRGPDTTPDKHAAARIVG